jgi:hypothetical protein
MVIAEMNMNIATNIMMVGNYRNRPTDAESIYNVARSEFDQLDEIGDYTGATDADVIVDSGYDDENLPMAFLSTKEKERLLFSLEDCFSRFRPRSGINKLRFFDGRFSHYSNMDMAKRPRYYMASKEDKFKYWTSYRTEVVNEAQVERGVSYDSNGQYFIDDAAPFVVYNESVPANRIVVKMQTHIGSVDLGPFSDPTLGITYQDPFAGYVNSRTPTNWSIQYLDENNNWNNAISFNQSSTRSDGSEIIKEDGYVEIGYGLIVPDEYKNNFVKAEVLRSANMLPAKSVNGYAYLVKADDSQLGTYHVWNNNGYSTFTPRYGWTVLEETVNSSIPFISDLTNPEQFIQDYDASIAYRDFQNIKGLRVVVETMNVKDATLDLIELSPRLAIDLSDKTTSFSITKSASDINISGMPVGQLLAGTGNISVFDYDLAFSSNNVDSIIHKYASQRIQFKFYEVIAEVGGYDYFVPLKTMYSEGIPEISSNREFSADLRDAFFMLETIKAPSVLIENASVSYAVSLLLDSIGFSNYTFKRNKDVAEPIIPYFFASPDRTVAEILNDIARSTQTAMFFDEYNNFVMMSREYIMPDILDRPTDITLYGDIDYADNGVNENEKTRNELSNILSIASQNESVYNGGNITYNVRYIQKAYGTIEEAYKLDSDQRWVYKPVPLWEVTASDKTKTRNGQGGAQEAYALTAIPLNTDLSDQAPYVDELGQLQNNIIDFGEAIYWMGRYNGYFYANGEVIRYDAVEYVVPGVEKNVVRRDENGQPVYSTISVGGKEISSLEYDSAITGQVGAVWIKSPLEYEKYFANVAFGGKIYPTGRVRIFAEPFYQEYVNDVAGLSSMKPGPVAKHGRGQFGTPIVEHKAGIAENSYWVNNDNVRGCWNQSKYIFRNDITVRPNTVANQAAGKRGTSADETAKKTTRNGIIKNFMSVNQVSENVANTLYATEAGSVQASALVMNGPTFATTESPLDFMSYVYKPMNNAYKHFGTRLRIIGRVESGANRLQTPVGSTTYYNTSAGASDVQVTSTDGQTYTVQASTPDESISVGGASAGLGVMLNPETNVGYYFEIAALTEDNVRAYNGLENIYFYKIESGDGEGPDGNDATEEGIPIKLWSGWSSILVDNGKFAGMGRLVADDKPTVYDLAVEYQDIGSIRRFYLYINNNLIGTADDDSPLPIYNNMALFVRGSARAMFENVYALSSNYSLDTSASTNTPVQSLFSNSDITTNNAFKKYAMSGIVQATYLSGISQQEPPSYSMYFEEFGTIMREAAVFNIKYDKAYPALYAKMFPNFNRIPGYTVSGFIAQAYGAEFIIFNATDRVISLDEKSNNHLVIQGITFNQDTQYTYTVDDYFKYASNFSDPQYLTEDVIISPQFKKKEYQNIKNDRATNGIKEFTLETPYIQSQESAEELMSWMVKKTMKPRKSVGLRVFSMPTLQLGDIAKIQYTSNDGIDKISLNDSRFVVYNIEYSRSPEGPEMTVYLSEVV